LSSQAEAMHGVAAKGRLEGDAGRQSDGDGHADNRVGSQVDCQAYPE